MIHVQLTVTTDSGFKREGSFDLDGYCCVKDLCQSDYMSILDELLDAADEHDFLTPATSGSP